MKVFEIEDVLSSRGRVKILDFLIEINNENFNEAIEHGEVTFLNISIKYI